MRNNSIADKVQHERVVIKKPPAISEYYLIGSLTKKSSDIGFIYILDFGGDMLKYGYTKNIKNRIANYKKQLGFTPEIYFCGKVYNPKELEQMIKDEYWSDHRGSEWMIEDKKILAEKLNEFIKTTYCPLKTNTKGYYREDGSLVTDKVKLAFSL